MQLPRYVLPARRLLPVLFIAGVAVLVAASSSDGVSVPRRHIRNSDPERNAWEGRQQHSSEPLAKAAAGTVATSTA